MALASDSKELEILPLSQAYTIPSLWYYDHDIYQMELKAVFESFWSCLGHVDQVRGNKVLSTAMGSEPVIVFEDSDEKLRAFINVCKHRGGPLGIKKGTKTVLQCQYHGWTYRDDGTLRGIPDWDRVELFDRSEFCLDKVDIQTKLGLIFGSMQHSETALIKLLQGIEVRIKGHPIEDYEVHQTETYKINCNWKVYVDNYLEGYHIPIVHPELATMLDYRSYKTECSEWHSLQYSPIKDGKGVYGEESSEALYYFIFPNLMLNILPNRLQINRVIPIDKDHCEVEFIYCYDKNWLSRNEKDAKEDLEISDHIQQEDIEICEAVQRGLKSDSYDKGRFSVKREEGVYHFQSLLKKVYKRYLEN